MYTGQIQIVSMSTEEIKRFSKYIYMIYISYIYIYHIYAYILRANKQ